MVMSLAVMVATRIAVNDGAFKEHIQHLLHRKLGCAGMDANAQLVQ